MSSYGCGSTTSRPAPTPRQIVKPVRVDVTLWMDETHLTDVHVHEDPYGTGPIVGFNDLDSSQRKEIARRLLTWATATFNAEWSKK